MSVYSSTAIVTPPFCFAANSDARYSVNCQYASPIGTMYPPPFRPVSMPNKSDPGRHTVEVQYDLSTLFKICADVKEPTCLLAFGCWEEGFDWRLVSLRAVQAVGGCCRGGDALDKPVVQFAEVADDEVAGALEERGVPAAEGDGDEQRDYGG